MTRILEAARLAPHKGCASRLNAWISIKDPAKEGNVHDRPARTPKLRPLNGELCPLIAVKDNICTTEQPTTCASKLLREFHSPFAATVVKKLEAAGISIAGKTNLDEFGMGSNSVHSTYGPVENWYLRDGDILSAGGSSGGSAIVVATNQCTNALGTDTGGSVRLPASYTGTVGFKPSYGLISRWGVIPYANSLDTVGILSQSVEGAHEIYKIIRGRDPQDPTSVGNPILSRRRTSPFQQAALDESSTLASLRLRIGIPIEYNTQELEPNVRQSWIDTLQALQDKGHSIHPISLPTTKLALSAYYIIAPAEASSNLAKYDVVRYGSFYAEERLREEQGVLYSDVRGAGLGDEVKRRILLGSFSLSAGAIDNFFIKAQRVRRLVQQDFNRVFSLSHPLCDEDDDHANEIDKVDVLVAPTALSAAPKMKDLEEQGPIEAYGADVLTVPFSLAGLPAISVPVRTSKLVEDIGPIGMQVIGQYGDDDTVIAAAKVIESLHDDGF